MHRLFAPVLGVGVVLVMAQASAAQALSLYDPYPLGSNPPASGEYVEGSIRTQGPAINGYAAGSVWGGNSSNFLVTSGSLSGGTGGKVQILGVTRPDPAGSDLTRYVVRNLASNSSSVYYMGGLVNRGSGQGSGEQLAAVNAGSFALTGFMNEGQENVKLQGTGGGAGNMFGLTWGFGGNAQGNYDLILRHRRRETDGSANIQPFNDVLLANAAAETSYRVVLKFELNANAPNGTRGNDGVTYWIGATDGSFDVSSESAATASALASGRLDSFGFNTASDLTRAVFAQYQYEATSAYFDENAIGATFASVVPEPASLGLLGLAGLALIRRRSR